MKAQRVKVVYGDDGIARDVSPSFPLPVAQPSLIVQANNLAMTATNNAVVIVTSTSGASLVGVQITGTWTGTVTFEATTDGATWFAVNGVASVTGMQVPTATANGQWRINAGGYTSVRVRSSVAGTGTAVVTLIGDPSPTLTTLAEPLPVGTNTIGNVGIVASSSFTQTTGTLTTSTVPSNPNTTSTTSAVVANVALAGNLTAYLYGGTYTALTLAFEVSPDGTNWFAINAARADGTGTDLSPSFTAATIRAWEIVMPGVTYFRVRATAITQTAAPTVVLVPGGIVYDPSPVVTGSVGVNPGASGTLVAPVAGVAAAQTPPVSGGTGTVNLTLTAATAAASLIAAPGAGLSIYVTDMEGSNSGATGTLHSLFEGTTNLRYARFVAASGGGYVTNLRTPWKLPANTAVGYASSAASTSNYLSVNYFVAP